MLFFIFKQVDIAFVGESLSGKKINTEDLNSFDREIHDDSDDYETDDDDEVIISVHCD